MIGKALMFLTWQTTFLGSFLVKPLFSEGKAIVQDMRDVFNIKSDLRYDLMQMFAGEAVLSEEFSQAGMLVGLAIIVEVNMAWKFQAMGLEHM